MLCHYNHICTSAYDMITKEKQILSVSINKVILLSCTMAAMNACNVHISYYLHNIKCFHLTRYIGQHKYRYILHRYACSLFNITFILHTTVLHPNYILFTYFVFSIWVKDIELYNTGCLC